MNEMITQWLFAWLGMLRGGEVWLMSPHLRVKTIPKSTRYTGFFNLATRVMPLQYLPLESAPNPTLTRGHAHYCNIIGGFTPGRHQPF